MSAAAEIRTSRSLGIFAVGFGLLGLVAFWLFESLRTPLLVAAYAVVVLAGLAILLDRRIKLVISPDGIRYASWGPAAVPWHEFSGYRWVAWRGQPYLELVARRPTELVESFSAYGKLTLFCCRLVRIPELSLAVSRLEIDAARLEELVSEHLPAQPPG